MTDQELQSLKRSSSKLDLLKKAELVRSAITRTFSEKSPHRQSQLKELDDFIDAMIDTLPTCPSGQLRSLENSIADAISLAQRTKIIAEFEAYADLLQDIQPVINRGILRWEQNERLRETYERKKLAASHAIDKALATLENDVAREVISVTHQEGQPPVPGKLSPLLIESLGA